ncbi:4-hydroxy-tetrahydrodipicolinate synthase [Rickettsiella grylli]|uniref:4-hydroxy-tetrahydrodipicolinate synthase n=1 Tax=Rickettsiella grylli TaxID=59196 RepID=UPI0008FD3E85|nr:4-hydroxy-tetrahydrodipicolinate synthase [Rickettsiella grylli]OJA00743.1 4-hydroxy-tetrahydrodipicolinate synthase [Rickettsiella grylli]
MFHGSIVALVTPMQENGSIDYASLRKLVDWHIAQGTDGIVVMGTTGEASTLTSEEHVNVIKTVVEQANQNTHRHVPIIAGTGTQSTQNTIEKTQLAMKAGVNACLLVTPYYNCPTQDGLYKHFSVIANKVPIPIILYNVPKRTGCDLLAETVVKLSSIPNIVGIKEGQVERVKNILKLCGKNFDVYSGDDNTALDIMQRGGKGVISVAANLVPQSMHHFCELAKKADWEAASKIDKQLRPLYQGLFIETNPIPVKWLAAQRGIISSSTLRLPLTPLSVAHQADLKPVINLVKTLS